jgi:hypothetical protein
VVPEATTEPSDLRKMIVTFTLEIHAIVYVPEAKLTFAPYGVLALDNVIDCAPVEPLDVTGTGYTANDIKCLSF